jgi:hypothetical protein
MEEQGFKKKYLAPLIVLMLCAVSLTGAAYAYSTTVTGNGDIQGDYYTIDMYDTGDKVVTASITSEDFFEVQTDRTIGKVKDGDGNHLNYGNYIASTVASKLYTDNDGKKYIQIDFNYKVMVQSSKTSGTTPIEGTVTYTQNASTGGLYADWAANGAVDCKAKFCETKDGAYDLTEVEFNKLYFMKITVLLPMIEKKDTGIDGTGTDSIKDYLKFDGKNCLKILLTAKN